MHVSLSCYQTQNDGTSDIFAKEPKMENDKIGCLERNKK
jgi:hypothetical protein